MTNNELIDNNSKRLKIVQQLPNRWVLTSLGEVATLVGGGTPSRKIVEYFGGSIVWLTPTEIPKNNVSVITDSHEHISELGLKKSAAKIIPEGAVLLTSRASIGYVAVAGTEVTTNQGFASFICNDGIYNFYLAYWLRANVNLLKREATGTTFKEISKAKLRPLKLPLAPYKEQIHIVNEIEKQFTRLDAAVANLKRVQANLERYKASVLKGACEGQLVSQDPDDEPAEVLLKRILAERRCKWEEQEWAKLIDKAKKKAAQAKRRTEKLPARISDLEAAEWEDLTEEEYGKYLPKGDKWKEKYKEPEPVDAAGLPELPEGWVWATPDQLASPEAYSLGIGPFGSSLKVSDYREQGVPLVFVRNIRTGVFDCPDTKHITREKAQELQAHSTFSGDLLITKMGDPPGDASIYPKNQPMAIVTADCVKWRLSSMLPDKRYFVHAIHAPTVHKQILRRTRGVAQRKISLGRFKTIAIPVPPAAEQSKIAAEAERLLSILRATNLSLLIDLHRSDRLRQSILEQAFSGRLVPQDPNDEPASALLERIQGENV